jgi:hypothetical protein
MELQFTSEQVLQKIKNMYLKGEKMTKRHVKMSDPELLRHAAYYYPSWEHACKEVGVTSQ